MLSESSNQTQIRANYPEKVEQATQYWVCIDLLLETDPFAGNGEPFNFCKLLAGSEGTLAFFNRDKTALRPSSSEREGRRRHTSE